MRRIKGVEVLKAQLRIFLDEVLYSIAEEMNRMERTVKISELAHNPFGSEVSNYVEAIRVLENQNIVIDTSFSDLEEKKLDDFVSDGEIGYDQLIDLLALLKELEGAGGEFASVLMKVDSHSIRFRSGHNDWICKCGNTPSAEGFYTCDADGNDIEPEVCTDWDHLYRCDRCGRVIDQRNHKVMGINLSPIIEDDI
ncbi:hypothetical protein WAE58_04320 [Pedobacter panaciterrae]|uniref:Uncharacterized protein n=1 Tax=Pedobacter panaciterrae TaxID=363849 RepID=A0ABU8NHA3_9SPHI